MRLLLYRATTELLARRHSGAVARGRFGTGGHERRRCVGHGPGRFSGTLRPNRRTACGYGNASARHDGRRGSDRAGAKIHRTALRLLVPTGQRQDVLQRTGMGKLPRPGRQQTISGPADEFPRGRLFAGLGEEIPQDIPGTNPNDMARDPQLKEVARCY